MTVFLIIAIPIALLVVVDLILSERQKRRLAAGGSVDPSKSYDPSTDKSTNYGIIETQARSIRNQSSGGFGGL